MRNVICKVAESQFALVSKLYSDGLSHKDIAARVVQSTVTRILNGKRGGHPKIKTVVKNSYGQFFVGGKLIKAHKAAWMLFKGSIPDDKFVLHKCKGGGNRGCVNPSHLYLGTSKDNARDKIDAGRMVVFRGQDNPASN